MTAQTTSTGAQSFIDQGLRALALKKYDQACDSLSQAVETLEEQHGELAPESADALMLYGKALLMHAIAQSAVLGGRPGGAEEREEATQNAVAGPSSGAPTAASMKFHFGGDAEEEEGEEEEGEEEEGGEEDDGGDKEDDLETAFMMLDMARTIWSKMEGKEAAMRRAEAHRLLGDVATESEQFDNAVTEYTAALSLLESLLEPYDRSLSELHMLIALALDFVPGAVGRAVEHAEKAKAVLLLKKAQLEGIPKEERTERDEKEIIQITELMGDVEMKIEDLKVVPEEAPKTESELTLEAFIRDATAPGKTQGIINDLNSLVKRKKPVVVAPVIEGEAASGSGLKRKAEDVVEGEGKKLKEAELP